MKQFFRNLLLWILKKLAQLTIWRYRPGVVGVTGTVGKTSTKLAIAAVLGSERDVRASSGNFNNEIGVPLTVLGGWKKAGGFFFWLRVAIASVFRLMFKVHYPEILILEYAVDRPGDMKYLLSIVRPNVSVVTAVGEIPVHVEFFNGPEDVAREKGKLVECLPVAGYGVLNGDDESVLAIRGRTRAQVVTYGFGKGNAVQVTGFECRFENNHPAGISFKVEHKGSFVPVRLDGVFGKAQGYAASAAAAVGLIFGMNLVKISEALRGYKPPPHRMEFIPGVKYTYVIDDTYNASPLSMDEALHVVKALSGKRRIAVLGDMLEIGKYTLEAHERVGQVCAKFLDILVTVGPRAKFIAEAAREAGMPKKRIQEFDVAQEAAKPVEKLLKRGDLVLVKGSRAMQMEKIVEEIKAF